MTETNKKFNHSIRSGLIQHTRNDKAASEESLPLHDINLPDSPSNYSALGFSNFIKC